MEIIMILQMDYSFILLQSQVGRYKWDKKIKSKTDLKKIRGSKKT